MQGEDADFNYASIDHNEDLDPGTVDQDEESKYFEDDEMPRSKSMDVSRSSTHAFEDADELDY